MHGQRIRDHLFGRVGLAALNLKPAQLIDRLRREPHVDAHGNAALGESLDVLCQPAGAFQFHHMGAGPHQPGGIVQCVFKGGATHERHVRHDQRLLGAAGHAFGVIGHIRNGDRDGAVVALQHVAQRIAHQYHFHAGIALKAGEAAVVGGEAGEFLPRLLHLLERGDCNLLHGGLAKWRWVRG